MTVYVDDFHVQATVGRLSARWCHMTADSTAELVTMADAIGLRRAWIQYPGTWKEHFDVTESRRTAAVKLGAQQISMRDSVLAMRARWAARAKPEDQDATSY